jgi:hypothetical protein
MNKSKISAVAAMLLVFAEITSHATTLTVGSGPTNVTTGYVPQGFKVLQSAEGGTDGSFATGWTVTIASSVLSGDTANPLGGLTFLYQVSVTRTNLTQLELGNYTGPLSKVNVADTTTISLGQINPYFLGNGTAPASADWLWQLDFNWSPSLAPSNHTDVLVVDTAATGWTEGFSSIDGGAFRVPTLIPIPEPAVLALAGLGAGALSLFRRRSPGQGKS